MSKFVNYIFIKKFTISNILQIFSIVKLSECAIVHPKSVVALMVPCAILPLLLEKSAVDFLTSFLQLSDSNDQSKCNKQGRQS